MTALIYCGQLNPLSALIALARAFHVMSNNYICYVSLFLEALFIIRDALSNLWSTTTPAESTLSGFSVYERGTK